MKNIYVMILFTFLSTCINIFSQTIPFSHLTTSNGLSNNSVNDIIQDHSGFLWFATDDGLNRYDGYDFKIYRHDSYNDNSLSDNTVLALCEDIKGNIWIGTKAGWLNCYDPVFDKFSKWRIKSEIVKENSITFIYEDSENKIWIGTYRSGLYRFDPVKGIIGHWAHDSRDNTSLSNNYISSIIEDEEHNLWISTYNGLNKINFKGKDKIFSHFFKEVNTQNCISDNTVWYLSKSTNDPKKIWIGTANGLTSYQIDKRTFSQIHFSNPNNLQFGFSAGSVLEEFDNEDKILWIDSYAGIIRLNLNDGTNQRFLSSKKEPSSILSNQVNRMIKDRSGVLWVATKKGISFYSPKILKFNSYFLSQNRSLNHSELSGESVTSITQSSDGKIWFGTEAGLYFSDNSNGNNFIKSHKNLNSLNVWSLTNGGYDDIWIGTYGYGVYQLNVKTGRLKSWLEIEKRKFSNSIRYSKVVYCDNKKNIWIGFWGIGLAKLNPRTNEYKTWVHNSNDIFSLSYNDVWVIFQDSKSRMWIGTNGGGLNLFEDVEGGKFYRLIADEDKTFELSSNTIYSICESRNGKNKSSDSYTILWIGTNYGLNKLFIQNKDNQNTSFPYDVSFTKFTKEDGLSDNLIKSIVEDNEGNLWLGTGTGISKFDTEKNLFINYNNSDGIVGTDFNFSSAFQDNSGTIYMGSQSGLNYFYPKAINLSTSIPPIFITDFQIFNNSVNFDDLSGKSILYTKEIRLSHSQDVFTFKFAALDFSSPQSIQYKYRMKGFSEDWMYNGNQRSVTYTNLNPGEYEFYVKSTNNDGIWNNNSASIKIIITPPWWQNAWAIILYIVILVLGIAGIVRFHINRVRLQHELKMQEFESHHLREIEKMKSRFFTNLSHDFRTPLMLIKGPLEQLISGRIKDNITDYYNLILRNTEKLQELIDQLLELSQLEAETVPLNRQQHDIVSLLKLVTESYYMLADETSITLNFKSSEDKLIALIDRDKLEKIINNLISNAFKFTPSNGKIDVKLSLDKQEKKDIATISISDTGIGIPEEHRTKIFDRFYQIDNPSKRDHSGSGIGLAIVKELVTLHNWNISVFSKIKEGTVFTLRIPLEKPVDQNIKVKASRSFLINSDSKNKNDVFNLNIKKMAIENEKNTASNKKPTILFVEDSADVRRYVYDLLNLDYEVVLLENANNGIKEAVKILPDLIISDIMMPGMDGLEFCHKIKTDWQTSHIPVILLTAKSTINNRVEGLETGADDYIIKPFSYEELHVRIKNLIDQRTLLREKFSKEINIQASSVVSNSIDKEFMNNVLNTIEKNLSNEEFDSEVLAKEIYLSRRQIHRKLLAVTGHTPGEFIRIYKLKRAAQMLIENKYSVTQIALEIGFKSPAQFTRAFNKHFNCLPSEFKEKCSHRYSF